MVRVSFDNNGKREGTSNDADVIEERSAKRKRVSCPYRVILKLHRVRIYVLKTFDKREMLIFNIRIKPSLNVR